MLNNRINKPLNLTVSHNTDRGPAFFLSYPLLQSPLSRRTYIISRGVTEKTVQLTSAHISLARVRSKEGGQGGMMLVR